jgi:hypothetical protein
MSDLEPIRIEPTGFVSAAIDRRRNILVEFDPPIEWADWNQLTLEMTVPHHEDDDLAEDTPTFLARQRAERGHESSLGPSEGDDANAHDAQRRRPIMRSDKDLLIREDRIATRDQLPPDLPTVDQSEHMDKFLAPFEHLNFLPDVFQDDYELVVVRDQEYNASWKARGGVGAFMMLARKWDRLEPMVARHGYDVFTMLDTHPDRIDDIRDLRRYLALVEAEWRRLHPEVDWSHQLLPAPKGK